jgi:hypothetical protein
VAVPVIDPGAYERGAEAENAELFDSLLSLREGVLAFSQGKSGAVAEPLGGRD